jgi:hypothetical protein
MILILIFIYPSYSSLMKEGVGTVTENIFLKYRKVEKVKLCSYFYKPYSFLLRWAGHVAHMGEDRGVHRVLVGKPEGKRLLGRPRRRWEDNIKVDLQEVGRGWSWGLDGVGSG